MPAKPEAMVMMTAIWAIMRRPVETSAVGNDPSPATPRWRRLGGV
ncbi:hypothetical protein [Piscicoccus intestinalis]|nr:hypothetical protein [Piscicoccus intestinalis]